MWSHVLGFGSVIPIIVAAAAGMQEHKRPWIAKTFALPFTLLAGIMMFVAVYLDQLN